MKLSEKQRLHCAEKPTAPFSHSDGKSYCRFGDTLARIRKHRQLMFDHIHETEKGKIFRVRKNI